MAMVKLRKPKVAEAKIVGLSKSARTNGGTTAPAGAAKRSPNETRSPLKPKAQLAIAPSPTASGNAGSTSSGGSTAPSPSPTSSAGPPETPGSITGRAGSEAKLKSSIGADAYKKYLAALAYGDPDQINYWGKIAAENGATGISTVEEGKGNLGQLLEIEKEEGKNQLANKFSHTDTNTFRSGFMLNDVNQIGEQAQKAKADAWTQLQNALTELQEAENSSNNEYAQEMGAWDEADRQAALEAEEAANIPEEEAPQPQALETQQQSTGLSKTYNSTSKNKKQKVSMGRRA